MMDVWTIGSFVKIKNEIYCDSIGVEYMYIRNPEIINWIQSKLNINNNHPKLSIDQKKQLLGKLVEAVSFEAVWLV